CVSAAIVSTTDDPDTNLIHCLVPFGMDSAFKLQARFCGTAVTIPHHRYAINRMTVIQRPVWLLDIGRRRFFYWFVCNYTDATV
ncbi:MAG: hypothetical protein K9N51_08575, partial [Candidatus Pacebacteria bacterium]|nr:hypothetical protein [Candidatus Paceibacterota bacterium]